MSEDENNQDERRDSDAVVGSTDVDLFGEFAVLSPGVQIVLDGRAVSTFGRN